MLHEMENYPDQTIGKMVAERCRPDYEAQIKGLKEKFDRSESLKMALLNYLNGRKVKGSLAEMLGELVSESVNLSKSITELIARQEADPEK